MRERFDANGGLIAIPVKIVGPEGSARLNLALDTGATTTLIRPLDLTMIGCDPARAVERVQAITGSAVESIPKICVTRISALGCNLENFPVLAHSLPPCATVDGLLGLDFLRGGRLTVDFRSGVVDFEI
jgi:predicted aspartyl protease